MKKQNDIKTEDGNTARQIVGISLPPEVASQFKMEAARRGISIRTLFLEMWAKYQAQS